MKQSTQLLSKINTKNEAVYTTV